MMNCMIMATVSMLAAYMTVAAPLNVSNSSLCYCRPEQYVNVTESDIESDTYKVLNNTLRTLYTYCDPPNLECNSSVEIVCDNCLLLTSINDQLETLLGILQPLTEVCEQEEKKFFRGEQSLYELCIAVDCEVKPSAQSVAKYLMSRSVRCDCEEDHLYVAGRCVEFEGDKNIMELYNALYNSVKSLGVLFCHLQVHPPFVDVQEVCAAFPPNDRDEMQSQVPPEPEESQ